MIPKKSVKFKEFLRFNLKNSLKKQLKEPLIPLGTHFPYSAKTDRVAHALQYLPKHVNK